MDQNLIKAYGNAPSEDPRETEGRALSEAARRLRVAQESAEESQILEAVRLNLRLWTIFQAELLQPECPLPLTIRQNVLSLAAFIDKHTMGIIFEPDAEKLNILISINRNISAGLLKKQEGEEDGLEEGSVSSDV
ncbi:MAG: flagellar biosynthesis regulator FlaF [Alphaproteobacteria bacterium]